MIKLFIQKVKLVFNIKILITFPSLVLMRVNSRIGKVVSMTIWWSNKRLPFISLHALNVLYSFCGHWPRPKTTSFTLSNHLLDWPTFCIINSQLIYTFFTILLSLILSKWPNYLSTPMSDLSNKFNLFLHLFLIIAFSPYLPSLHRIYPSSISFQSQLSCLFLAFSTHVSYPYSNTAW